jgi:hypothetical protein
MGRHCFDTSALDGGLSETELMAAQWRGRSTIWQDSFRATFSSLLNIFRFIIGRTTRNFRGHIQRNGIDVCDRINRNPHSSKTYISRFPCKYKRGCSGAYGGVRRSPRLRESYSLQSGGRFCVGAFGRNLASCAVQMFSHLISCKKK